MGGKWLDLTTIQIEIEMGLSNNNKVKKTHKDILLSLFVNSNAA